MREKGKWEEGRACIVQSRMYICISKCCTIWPELSTSVMAKAFCSCNTLQALKCLFMWKKKGCVFGLSLQNNRKGFNGY